MERKQRITKVIDLSKVGLEIGPLASPILGKDEARIYYLDHMDNKELEEKYKYEPVELDKIPKLDYVLHDRTPKETVGQKKFDYVIASHVIEHVPNMAGWLDDMAGILKVGGILSLVIPDKRYIFDINRRVSAPADIIGAYFDKQERFSTAMMYDFASECLGEVDTAEAWQNPERYKNAQKRWSLDEVIDKCQKNLSGEYIDCHCHVFTPRSFVEIIRTLILHDLISFEIAYFLETQENEIEFYVSLRKVDKKTKQKQLLSQLPYFQPDISKTEKLEEQVAILEQELHALRHSLSWRATRYLRWIKGKAVRPKN